jgi:hypothetical protein
MKLSLRDTLQVLGMLGGIVTFVWGVTKWEQAKHRQLEDAAKEAKRPYLERQLALYEQATVSAAQVTVLPDGPELDRAKETFWTLYWGSLAMVEDTDVEREMVAFGRALEVAPSDRPSLKQLALSLADTCRRSLSSSWGTTAWMKEGKSERPQ